MEERRWETAPDPGDRIDRDLRGYRQPAAQPIAPAAAGSVQRA
jgi:hypothetical protein